MELTGEQRSAVAELRDFDGDAISLTGYAGTGKTVCLKHAFEDRADVTFAAMTGKAARRITEATGFAATTLHSQLYYPPSTTGGRLEFGRVRPAPGGIIVVDEASMVTPAIAQDLQSWMSGAGGDPTGVVFVGDDFQLPPILTKVEAETYGSDYSIFGQVKGPRLTKVMRSDSGVLEGAAAIRERGQVLRESIPGYTYSQRKLAYVLAECAAHGHPIITWRNKVRMEAARAIREIKGITVSVPVRGEPLLLCKNGQGKMNGEIVLVDGFTPGPQLGPVKTLWLHPIDAPKLLVSITGGEEPLDGQMAFLAKDAFTAYNAAKRRESVPEPIPVTWGYVLTAHKAQGSEYDKVVVYMTPSDTENRAMLTPSVLPSGERVAFWRRWAYTAVTRAKHEVEVVIS